MPRAKHSSVSLLAEKLPTAIVEGWTLAKLAKVCHCCEGTAAKAMRSYAAAKRARELEGSGELAETMRGEATRLRHSLIARLPRLEAALDAALDAAEEEGDTKQLKALVGSFAALWKLGKDATGLAVVEKAQAAEAVAAAKGRGAASGEVKAVREVAWSPL